MVRPFKQEAYNHSLKNANNGIIHPVLACVRLTRKCNLRCAYCSELYVNTGKDLKQNDWKNAVDVIYKLGNRDIVFTGGEPLLRSDLVDIVRHASSRDAFVSIATNGLLLDKKYLADLSDAKLDFLCISVDTLNKNSAWGKPLTDKLAQTLEHISKSNYGFDTTVSTVVTRHNLMELPEIVSYFSSLKIPTKLMIMMQNHINKNNTKALSLEKNSAEIEVIVKKLLMMKNEGALLMDGDFTLSRLSQYFKGEFNYNCNGGVYDLSVNNDGKLVICPNGIISDKSIFDLTTKKYVEFIEENKTITDNCKGCLWSFNQRLEDSIKNYGVVKNEKN